MPGKFFKREEQIEVRNGETHHTVKTESRELSDAEMDAELKKLKEGFGFEGVDKMFADFDKMMKGFFGGNDGGRARQQFQSRR